MSLTIPKIPNEARPEEDRILAGATVNAPGAELANSSHTHECVVGSQLQAAAHCVATARWTTADNEEELELTIISKKLKKSRSKPAAIAAANVDGELATTSYSTTSSSQCYMLLLYRLYQCHCERFGEEYRDNGR